MTPTDRSRPIGVFDSGVGGLTVVAAVLSRLPSERIVYLGDTARVPYGTCLLYTSWSTIPTGR